MNQKILKRFGALLLAAILLLTPLTSVSAAAQTGERLTLSELMEQPDALITRGEFAMMVNSVFQFQSDGQETEGFLDVPEDHPYAEDILIAKAIGYLTGDGKGNAYPDMVMSGAGAAAVVNLLLGFDASKTEPAAELSVPAWAAPSASVLLDLTMADEELLAKTQLTVGDAADFINALAVAVMFQGSPYALTQADLEDDFFAYTNRQYLATATLPTGYPYVASFVDTTIAAENQKQEILQEILTAKNLKAGSDEWKINELYKLYMDNEARTASLSEVQPYLDEIRAVKTVAELMELAQKYSTYFNLQPFYGLSVNADAKVDATQWCALVAPGTLDLGSKEYYAEDESLAGIQQAYRDYLGAMLKYIGETEEIEKRVGALYAIESGRAAKALPAEVLNDPQVLYTETTWEAMLEATSTTGTLTHMEDVYEILKDLNIYCPSMEYVTYIEGLYKEENLQALKDTAMLSVLSEFAPVLGDDLAALSDGLEAAMIGQVGEKATLEQRAQSFVSSMMSQAFSRMYAERYGTEEIKNDVTEIIESIRDKFRERIGALTWMSDETKAKAVEKLDAIQAYVAYPDEAMEAVSYEVKAQKDGGNLIDLLISVADVSYDELLSLLKEPVDHNPWASLPTSTVNAFYSPMSNSIIIPLGILQDPFYNSGASREENLGAIGAVIAHEITHAFDTTGAQFDKNGTLTNWWAEEDYAVFAGLAADISEDLSAIAFAGDVNVNGALCVGETIADLGAMACVLDIADDTEGTDLSKVMEAWAAVWAMRMSPEMAEYFLRMDTHAPNKVRVNFILSQTDVFYTVFDVTEEDGMYLPVDERVAIW